MDVEGRLSGSNGFTVDILLLYSTRIQSEKTYWIGCCTSFDTNTCMLQPLNHTFLVLIPKKENPSTRDEYRIISCIGITYKKNYMFLANMALPNLISSTQTTFIKGRRISICVNLA